MTPRLSLLFASTTLSLTLGLPALAAVPSPGSAPNQCSSICAAVFGAEDPAPLVRVSGDDEDEDDEEDCDDDEEEDDDEEDDDDCTDTRANPAPAGTVAPPPNGLFGTGAPPVAVTN